MPPYTVPWDSMTYRIPRTVYEEEIVVKDFRKPMTRQRYILLKDTPELRKGAVLEEDCDDGDQGFTVVSQEWNQQQDQISVGYTRETVTNAPEWFTELTVLYVTKQQLNKVKDVLFPPKKVRVVAKRGRPKKK